MNLSFFLELHAANNPFSVALIHEDKCISFKQLNELSNKFANLLGKQNIKQGDRIILLLPNTLEFAVSFFGSLKAGIIPLPINTRLKTSDILFMVEDVKAKAVVTIENFESSVCRLREDRLDILIFGSNFSLKINDINFKLESFSSSYKSVPKQHNDIASLMYTAGSTGKPKPVIHTHGNHLYRSLGFIYFFDLNNRDVGLAVSPLFHISGMYMMFRTLMLGAPLVLMDKWEVEEFLRLIKCYSVTFFHLITTAFLDVVNTDTNILKKYKIDSVRVTCIGGGVCTIEHIKFYEKTIGGWCSEGYGRTEGGQAWNPPTTLRKLGSNGLILLDRKELMIAVDGNPDKPAQAGEVGEILARGDGVSSGYFNRPDVNNEAFRSGWMLTNDIGLIDDDDFLYFKGRKDDLIKTGGENVYPAEIENCLLRMGEVKEAAVFGVPDTRWGERIVAAVKIDRSISEEEIKKFCRSELPNFKCPKQIVIVDKMPKIGPKKIDKTSIKKDIFKI